MYELTLICTGLDNDEADHLLDDFDCVIGTDHTGQEFITLVADGADVMSAAKTAITKLYCAGVTPERVQEDLVSRQDIADRLTVTRQAVGQWVRGDRGGNDFPRQFNPVAGGVWLWADVNDWAIATGRIDDGVRYPTSAETAAINEYIASKGYVHKSEDFVSTAFWEAMSPSSGHHAHAAFTTEVQVVYTPRATQGERHSSWGREKVGH